MSKKYNSGTKVEWDWGSGTATGEIQKSYTDRIEVTIKGEQVVRNASDENPAYLIEQADGDQVLKSHSEVRKAG